MDPLFTTGVLEDMVALEQATMPDRATLYEMMLVDGAGGGKKRVAQAIATDVPCRISKPRVAESVRADQLGDASRWLVVVPLGTAIPADGKIEVEGTNYAGVDFVFTGKIIAHDAARTHATRIALECIAEGPRIAVPGIMTTEPIYATNDFRSWSQTAGLVMEHHALPYGSTPLSRFVDNDAAVALLATDNVGSFSADGVKMLEFLIAKGLAPAVGGSRIGLLQSSTFRALAGITWDIAGAPIVNPAGIGTLSSATEVGPGVWRVRLLSNALVLGSTVHNVRIYPAITAAQVGDLYVGSLKVYDTDAPVLP